jgi:aspartate kinase
MLTCDPRVLDTAYRLKAISFEEAAALARSGATVLHPDTVTPAIRQRIPIVIRNSRRPEVEGTRITEVAPACSNPVKAIACKSDLTVLELQINQAGNPDELAAALSQLCARHGMPAEFLCRTNDAIFLGLKSTARYQDLPFELDGCVEVRLHPRAASLSLVGAGIAGAPDIPERARVALKQIPATVVSDVHSRIAVSLIVPRMELQRSVEILHSKFFQQVDPAVFGESVEPRFQSPQPFSSFVEPADRAARTGTRRRPGPLTVVSQN